MLEGAALRIETEWADCETYYANWPTVYTGHLDEAMRFVDGRLPWISARFDTIPAEDAEPMHGYHCLTKPRPPIAELRVANYDAFCLLPSGRGALIGRQYPKPTPDGITDRIYPYPSADARNKWRRYRAILPDKFFVAGRAGLHRYLNMDAAVQSGLDAARSVLKEC
jgi:UDP-galactopyranose mutase